MVLMITGCCRLVKCFFAVRRQGELWALKTNFCQVIVGRIYSLGAIGVE
jgi:hypothetical protein